MEITSRGKRKKGRNVAGNLHNTGQAGSDFHGELHPVRWRWFPREPHQVQFTVEIASRKESENDRKYVGIDGQSLKFCQKMVPKRVPGPSRGEDASNEAKKSKKYKKLLIY